MSLRLDIAKDLIVIEKDIGEPTFTWNGTAYKFIPSITDFRRELDSGGFKKIRRLTATVRRVSSTGTALFTNLPQPQDLFTYSADSVRYRIIEVKQDVTGAYFRLIGESDTRGL